MQAEASSSSSVDSACRFWRCTVLGQVDDIKSKLDPISVLAVLALLNFKESGTLIGFTGYLITTEAPSTIQGAVRRLFIESREDLAVIPNAIEKASLWFQPELGEKNVYRDLFIAANRGLKKLQETYLKKKQSDVTASAISDWMKAIKENVQPKEADEKQPQQRLSETLEKVRGLWSTAEIRELNSLIEQMVENQGDVSPDFKIRCGEQIARLELLLKQKASKLATIHDG